MGIDLPRYALRRAAARTVTGRALIGCIGLCALVLLTAPVLSGRPPSAEPSMAAAAQQKKKKKLFVSPTGSPGAKGTKKVHRQAQQYGQPCAVDGGDNPR